MAILLNYLPKSNHYLNGDYMQHDVKLTQLFIGLNDPIL